MPSTRRFRVACSLATLAGVCGGCATLRTTDPQRTATEQFLISRAASQAVAQLSVESLRDYRVWLNDLYLIGPQNETSVVTPEQAFLLGETRNKLLEEGVRLVSLPEQADIVLEIRSGALSIDRQEYLLGIPAIRAPGASVGDVPLLTPELSILKNLRQFGFADVSVTAFWADTGELVVSSGPAVGRTFREDYWIFGFGPRTLGNIPPAERSGEGPAIVADPQTPAERRGRRAPDRGGEGINVDPTIDSPSPFDENGEAAPAGTPSAPPPDPDAPQNGRPTRPDVESAPALEPPLDAGV